MTRTTDQPPECGEYSTAAQWWDALGNVPLDRIVFNPRPGFATEADVLRLDSEEDRLCELVDNTLVEKTMGFEESMIAMLIGHLLLSYVQPRKLGVVSGSDGMMRISSNLVRIPDVAFISFDRLPDRKLPTVPIPDIAPNLAIEVLSDSNTPREMQNKLREYFNAGTRLVWYVDLKAKTVDVYTSPDQFTRLTIDQTLTGGDVLPGFSTPVSAIFDIGR